MQGISIVVPAFNEEKRLGATLQRYLPALKGCGLPYEVIVVVDGVSDLTSEVARAYWEQGVKVLEYPHRLGKGGAVITGMRLARYDFVGYIDADGPIAPADIHRMIRALGEVDCVIASRWSGGSTASRNQPIVRILAGRCWNLLVRAVLFLPVNDTQCGAKLFRRVVLDSTLRAIAITNWAFDVSLLYHMKKSGHSLKEIPVNWRHDVSSHLPSVWMSGTMFLASLIGIRLMNTRIARRIPGSWIASFQSRWGH